MLGATLSSGWFLENAWLIPLVPAIGFVFIILFGKKMPQNGSEIGIVSIGISLAISIGATFQWIDRVNSASGGSDYASGGFFGASEPSSLPLPMEATERRLSSRW